MKTIQIKISDHLYNCLLKRIELDAASEIDKIVYAGKIIEKKYDCSCYRHYPNRPKCAERYDCVRDFVEGGKHWDFKTHCKKKVKVDE